MTVKGVVARFLITYILLLVAIGQILHWIGIRSNEAMFIGMLIGSTLWPCMAFGWRNRRYFTSGEQRLTIAILLLIDICIQVLFGNVPLPGMSGLSLLDSLARFGLLLILHAAVIAFFVNFAGKQLVKQGVLKAEEV